MTDTSVVDPVVRALITDLDPIIEDLNTAFRKDDKHTVLSMYDVLSNMPELMDLAERLFDVRPECQILEAEELSVNVLEPTFVQKRVQELSNRRSKVVTPSATSAHSRTVSPGSVVRVSGPNGVFGGSGGCGSASEHGVAGNTRVGGSGMHLGNGDDAAATAVSATAKALYDTERRVEQAWALGLLVVQIQTPDEEDHHLEILEEFEERFSRPSEVLRAVRGRSSTAREVCETYHSNELSLTPDVLLAALIKHPPRSTDEIADFVAYVREKGVPLTMQVAEMLERCYVKCMKEEGAEAVFHRMTKEVGLVPLTTRPFAMLFNAKSFTKAKNVLDYYELMLDYGISPEPSLLRILCKQCSGMEYASLHFTLRLKSIDQQQQLEAKGPNGAATSPAPATAPAPDSRRKNERAYFEKRLEDMAEQNPNTPLMEAMKVVHRAEVEGTSLEGDTLILTALLKLFCNGTTPVSDLVKPFSASVAYRPGVIDNRAALEAAAAAEEERRRGGGGSGGPDAGSGGGGGRFTEKNAFDFGLDDANLETLDDMALEDDRDGAAPGRGKGAPVMGGAAALWKELEGEGLLDGGLEDEDDELAAAGADDNLEELAHKKFVEQGGGLTMSNGGSTAATGTAGRHSDPMMALEDDDAASSEDDLDEAGKDSPGISPAGKGEAAPRAAAAADPKASSSSAAAAATGTASERQRRTPRHIPGIASPNEEAAYVLDVLASYGSLPDNNMLNLLATQYVNRGNSGIGVVQQVTQALFRAGHDSRGAVEAVRSSSCHCLVRYYIRRHQRGKLTQLVRSFVEQCYEYNHVFCSSWAGDLDPRSANYYLRNNTTFIAFATAAMKAGPLDWALGLLALVFCMSSHPITDNTKARLYQVCEGEPYSSRHRDMIEVFDQCRWDRDAILADDVARHKDSRIPPRSSEGDRGHGAGGGKGHGDDIYTTSVKEAQHMSSYENPRGLNGPSSLESYMHSALREMNLDRDVMDYFKDRLRTEQAEAVDRVRRSDRGGSRGANTSGGEQQQQQASSHSQHHQGSRRGRR